MKEKNDISLKAKQEYIEKRPKYEGLNTLVCGTIESLLKKEKIAFLSVSGRTKAVESFEEKIERKNYDNPSQEITDLCGIRIITYIEEEVEKASKVIRDSFHVHDDKSLNKSDELEVDRFGYRSVHFICDLGTDRIKLPEYSPYKGMVFEIQIRTVLQHAWAEIEHDRSYKFSEDLPKAIKRRLFNVAGLLEVADREFNAIAQTIDKYKKDVGKKTKEGNFDIELNTVSFTMFMKIQEAKLETFDFSESYDKSRVSRMVNELKDFGIKSLAGLDNILNQEIWDLFKSRQEKEVTIGGICRTAMMYEDIDGYFEKCWQGQWTGLQKDIVEFLEAKYSPDKISDIFSKYNLALIDIASIDRPLT